MELAFKLASPVDMTEQVAYRIWATAVTTTKAFGHVSLKIDGRNCRIYLSIHLKWWAKAKRLSKLREVWLHRAETKVSNSIPEGWRFLIYYGEQGNGDDSARKGQHRAVDFGDVVRQGGSDSRNSRSTAKRSKSRTGSTNGEVPV